MKVLISIKPEFVEKIFSGEKQFEYRKSIFKRQNIDTIIIYETKPIGKIVGEIQFNEILVDTPQNIWNKTKEKSGISEKFFFEYFQNRNLAYAIKINKTIKYGKAINPKEEGLIFTAPQSFRYIKDL